MATDGGRPLGLITQVSTVVPGSGVDAVSSTRTWEPLQIPHVLSLTLPLAVDYQDIRGLRPESHHSGVNGEEKGQVHTVGSAGCATRM